MTSQISTTKIIEKRGIRVLRFMLDSSSSSGIVCGLVLWMIVPHLLPQHLTGYVYRDFLFSIFNDAWKLHLGRQDFRLCMKVHFSRPVRDVTNDMLSIMTNG